MERLYRPEWTCGRYHKTENNSYALIYNLLEGISFFFEDESADIINEILKSPKNSTISVQSIVEATMNQFSNKEIIDFCSELISVGLLTNEIISDDVINDNRKKIGRFRQEKSIKVEKTVQERLPFHQTDAEGLYIDILEKDQIPFAVMIELTYNCNEKCVHCFNPGAARNEKEISTRNNREEINIEHYKVLLDDLKQLGVVKIVLTGGDPFVKKDIWKLIEMIYEKDFIIDIYTNGLAILGRVNRLAQFYPNSVGLSIYSAEDEIHNKITRVPNSLKKTLSVANDLMNLGVPIYFKCPIMNHNANSYFTVENLAKKYGATVQFDITLTDSVDGDVSISEQLQVDGELLEIILRDPNIPLYVGKEAPNFGKQERNKNEVFCGAGINIMSITPEGNVTPCNSFPTQFGNLKEQSFSNIWKNSNTLKNWQKTVIADYEECGNYERCGYCNRCPGQSFIEHGTPLKASTANCYNASVRMNLAAKLRIGDDPLKGLNIEDRLKGFNTEIIEIVSNNDINYRNTELNITK